MQPMVPKETGWGREQSCGPPVPGLSSGRRHSLPAGRQGPSSSGGLIPAWPQAHFPEPPVTGRGHGAVCMQTGRNFRVLSTRLHIAARVLRL